MFINSFDKFIICSLIQQLHVIKSQILIVLEMCMPLKIVNELLFNDCPFPYINFFTPKNKKGLYKLLVIRTQLKIKIGISITQETRLLIGYF